MNCSRALKWFLAFLIPLTVGWKVFLHTGDARDIVETPQDRVAGFLVSHQFSIAAIGDMPGEMPAVHAQAGTCNILVAVASPRGWHRDLLRNLAKPSDDRFIVYGGRIYAEQPMLLTITNFLSSKFLSQLGLPVYARPVFSVIASKDCEAEHLPWNELG